MMNVIIKKKLIVCFQRAKIDRKILCERKFQENMLMTLIRDTAETIFGRTVRRLLAYQSFQNKIFDFIFFPEIRH
jgi:hypothetical protein